jgi:hypothetical protein
MPRNRVLILLLLICASAHAQKKAAMPVDVLDFTDARDQCDHFRGEPIEGDDAATVQRRKEVLANIKLYCTGTDRKLAQLKRKYADSDEVLARLAEYETKVE